MDKSVNVPGCKLTPTIGTEIERLWEPRLPFSASNNRITNSGYTYDAVGNLTNDSTQSFAYDAENKITKVDNVAAYVYDGEGQRVRKLLGENLRFVYGIGGQLNAEFSGATGALQKEYIYGLATRDHGQVSPLQDVLLVYRLRCAALGK